MPTGMVSFTVSFMTMNGQRKLFQAAMKVTMASEKVMLQFSGRKMLNSTRNSLAPSMRAASPSSGGI